MPLKNVPLPSNVPLKVEFVVLSMVVLCFYVNASSMSLSLLDAGFNVYYLDFMQACQA